jgi:hypothetical protein
MPNQRYSVVGVIAALVIAALALFAFTRQQQSATHEATAVAKAEVAVQSQLESDAERQTAVAQANVGGTAQAEAQQSEAAAIAQSNAGATAQANAESAQSEAESAQATAVAQANDALTALAQAEATRAAAVENAQSAATAAQNQAATATVAMGQAISQAELAQTAVSISSDSATAASEQQQSAQATGTTIRGQNAAIRQTATAQAGELEATQAALAQIAGTLQAPLTPVARINQTPEDTMRFLVANEAIDTLGGRVAARLETNISLTGKDNWNRWEDFTGNYTDFVISADISWGDGAEEDQCGLILREQEDKNFYVLVYDRYGYLDLVRRMDGDWHNDFPFKTSSAIRTGKEDVNHIVMVVQKDEFLVYINDQPAGYYVDRNLSEGEVGVFATTYDESDETGCNFTNGWVWSLEGDAPTVTPIQPTALAVVPTETPVQPTIPPSTLPAYSVPELSETFTYSNNAFSLHYPQGWIADQLRDNTVSLSSGSRTTALFRGNAPDEILMNLATTSQSSLEGISLNTLIRNLISNINDTSDPDSAIDFGEPELFQLGQHEALRAIGRSQHYDLEIIVFGKDNGVVLVYVACGAGNMKRCEPTVYAIAETVTYKFNPDASENGFWTIR